MVILKSDTNDTPFARIPPDIDVTGHCERDKRFLREVGDDAEETTDDPIKTMKFDRLYSTGCCQDTEKSNRKSNRTNAPGMLRPAYN